MHSYPTQKLQFSFAFQDVLPILLTFQYLSVPNLVQDDVLPFDIVFPVVSHLDSSLALFAFHYYDGFEDWHPEISPCLMFLYNKNEFFGLPNKWHCVPLRLLYL